MSLALAVIADIIPPRERGRYQGYFSVVFVSSSVIGPLLGGFFVDSASWRWVFYVNLPLGLVALVVINRVLHLPFTPARSRSTGPAPACWSPASARSCVGTQTGGRDFGWTSPQLLGMFGAGFAADRRLRLARARGRGADPAAAAAAQRHFRVTSLDRLPDRRRHVRRDHLPAAVPAGGPRHVRDRERPDDAAGAVRGAAHVDRLGAAHHRASGATRASSSPGRSSRPSGWRCWLSSGHTPRSWSSAAGCSSPAPAWACSCRPLVMATQSAVETRDLGIATSSIMFFRTMGGAVCASAFGALLTNRLAVGLTHHLPPAVARWWASSSDKLVTSPDAVKALRRGPSRDRDRLQHRARRRLPRRRAADRGLHRARDRAARGQAAQTSAASSAPPQESRRDLVFSRARRRSERPDPRSSHDRSGRAPRVRPRRPRR